jgi:hypothetical protein
MVIIIRPLRHITIIIIIIIIRSYAIIIDELSFHRTQPLQRGSSAGKAAAACARSEGAAGSGGSSVAAAGAAAGRQEADHHASMPRRHITHVIIMNIILPHHACDEIDSPSPRSNIITDTDTLPHASTSSMRASRIRQARAVKTRTTGRPSPPRRYRSSLMFGTTGSHQRFE